MWGVGRFPRMADFIAASQSAGFGCIELNHQITEPMLSEIVQVYESAGIIVSSVHDPCPNAASKMELLPKVSDLDESARQAGVRCAKSTIDLANRLQAPYMVIHVGDVAELRDPAQSLRDHFKQSGGATLEYRSELAAFKRDLVSLQQPHLDAVARSLEELVPYARERGVRLGLENRYYVNEIPDVSQADWLLKRFPDGVAGYWHDVGHAEVQERMGFAPHRQWLETLGARIIGVHIHDVLPGTITDHQAAGLGNVDLGMVLAHLPAAAQRVCEFDRRNSPDQVKAGLQHLSQLGFFAS